MLNHSVVIEAIEAAVGNGIERASFTVEHVLESAPIHIAVMTHVTMDGITRQDRIIKSGAPCVPKMHRNPKKPRTQIKPRIPLWPPWANPDLSFN